VAPRPQKPVEDARARLVRICHELPEVTSDGAQHVRFQIRNKTFAYYLDDHHGDGRVALVCKAAPGEQEALIASDPERFYRPAYLWHRGWVAMGLDTDAVDWGEVRELIVEAYRVTAPKRLARMLD
jgi:hypothetical protein